MTGDLTRKPQLRKNEDFCATVKSDAIGTTLHYSNSIRTLKSDQVLNAQPGFDVYSSNNQLKHYKAGLVKTKSVDRITPHNHSNKYSSIR